MKIETGHLSPAISLDTISKKPLATRLAEETQQPVNVAYSVKLSGEMPWQDDEEIRRAKVAAIRDQLSAGSYSISGRDVATKILNAFINS